MVLKAAALSFGLFFALTPPAHATKADDEVLKKLANQSIEKGCYEVAKGAASLQKAILETAQENVKWLAVVMSMSLELRVHLAENLATESGFSIFKDYLKNKLGYPDETPSEAEALSKNVDLNLMTSGKSSDDRLNYELREWKAELRHHFGLASDQPNDLSLAQRQFQYAEAVVRITSTAFATLPKADRKRVEFMLRMISPTADNGAIYGAILGLAADVVLYKLFPGSLDPTSAIPFVFGGGVLGYWIASNKWLRKATSQLLSAAQVTTSAPLLQEARSVTLDITISEDLGGFRKVYQARNGYPPPQGLLLKDVYLDEAFPDKLALSSVSFSSTLTLLPYSQKVSLIGAVQLGAWELAVLEAEAVTELTSAAKLDLALELELYRRKIIRVQENYKAAARRKLHIPDPAEDVLRVRLDKADRMIDELIKPEQRLENIKRADALMRAWDI